MTLPGANVFFTDEDLSTPDGQISCKQVDPDKAAYEIFKAARYLLRLVDL